MTTRAVAMLVAQYWPAPEGGAERQCRALAAHLAARGCHLRILTRRIESSAPRHQDFEGTHIRRLGPLSPWTWQWHRRRRLRPIPPPDVPEPDRDSSDPVRLSPGLILHRLEKLAFFAAAAAYLRRHRHELDLLHIHESHWIAGFGAWIGHRLGLPTLVKEASFPVLMPIGADVWWRPTWESWRLRSPYLAQTPEAATALAAAGVDARTIFVTPNGVEIPGECSDPGAQRHALYVGNLTQGSRWKAFDVLFESWIQLARQRPESRLIVVGGGSPDPWIRQLAAAGASETVEFVGAVQDPRPYYRKAALLVLPSRREGMSNALLEAMSWGVPAVVSDIPGNRSVIRDDYSGRVVPVDQPAALCDALRDLLDRPGERSRLGRGARADAVARFSFPAVVDQMLKIYDQVVPPGRR